MLKIISVTGKKDLKQFIDFPHELYAGDQNYVPELFIAQRDMLTKGKHPSLQHIDLQLFLAVRDNKIVGRIAGIHNKNHTQFTNDNSGFFGFFDSEKNFETARELLNTAIKWVRERGLKGILGPVNFSTNDPCGLLIDGFDSPPQVMMTYNKAYYQQYIELYGFSKRMDLFSYWFDSYTIPDRVMTLAGNIEQRLNRNGITIRKVNMKNFKQEVQSIKKIYNEAWDKNWGFVPFTDEEFDYVAKDMKLILDKDFVLLAEKNNEVIGFSLALPNINEIQKDVKRGRLFPTGIFKLLLNKSKIKSLRVITLGVLDPYRMLGIEACFYTKITETARKKGIKGGEASWILENNEMMNRELQNIGSRIYKTHRLYTMNLS
jgi:GNAT superfamily N-acetyltransferase